MTLIELSTPQGDLCANNPGSSTPRSADGTSLDFTSHRGTEGSMGSGGEAGRSRAKQGGAGRVGSSCELPSVPGAARKPNGRAPRRRSDAAPVRPPRNRRGTTRSAYKPGPTGQDTAHRRRPGAAPTANEARRPRHVRGRGFGWRPPSRRRRGPGGRDRRSRGPMSRAAAAAPLWNGAGGTPRRRGTGRGHRQGRHPQHDVVEGVRLTSSRRPYRSSPSPRRRGTPAVDGPGRSQARGIGRWVVACR